MTWRQKGTTALLYLGGVIALAAIGAGVFFGAKSYIDGVDTKAFNRGMSEAEAAYVKRDNEALAAATKHIKDLQAKVRASEARAAADVATIDNKYQEELTNARHKAERDVADARSGALKLRDRWRSEARACAANSDRSADASTTGASGSNNEKAGTELSREATEFLLREANRADEITKQLGAAQELILEYVETVNGRD